MKLTLIQIGERNVPNRCLPLFIATDTTFCCVAVIALLALCSSVVTNADSSVALSVGEDLEPDRNLVASSSKSKKSGSKSKKSGSKSKKSGSKT